MKLNGHVLTIELLAALISLPFLTNDASSESSFADTDRMLEKFSENSFVFMQQLPTKTNRSGKVLSPDVSRFSNRDVSNRNYVDIKNRARELLPSNDRVNDERAASSSNIKIFSAGYPSDGLASFAETIKHQNLESMEKAKLTSGSVETAPWSGDYWPFYMGGLARRFGDPEFPNSEDWKENTDFLLTVLNAPQSSSLDTLSPAEKYDLIVGDLDFTLTRKMIEVGKKYYDADGTVETWMGICHGWAPAAYTENRPKSKIEVMGGADGKVKIPLYPSDIKGIATLMWAEVNVPGRIAGTRCNSKSPKLNSVGRIVEQPCFDENPGGWHLAVVNQLGFLKKSFVLDVTFDYQVWNQPVHSYRYHYFNPQTLKSEERLEKATVKRSRFSADKFKEFRSPDTTEIVGVAMDLTYVVETPANTTSYDNESFDERVTVQYLYDLELDSDGNIIGGEWYNNVHPDFLWMPEPGRSPRSAGDLIIENIDAQSVWIGDTGVPESWKKAASVASQRRQPLARVVKTLVLLSQIN